MNQPTLSARISQLEEIHYPIEECFFAPDGIGEEWIDVCAHCNELDDNYAAAWPCETMQDIYYELSQEPNSCNVAEITNKKTWETEEGSHAHSGICSDHGPFSFVHISGWLPSHKICLNDHEQDCPQCASELDI